MVRKNFAQALKEGIVDVVNEYDKLYDIFYKIDKRDGYSLAGLLSDNFSEIPFRGTCLSLDEFNWAYGFDFYDHRHVNDIDYLVSFAEYIYNFVYAMHERFFFSSHYSRLTILDQILVVIEHIGYSRTFEDGFTIFVPKDNVAVAVSESKLIPPNLSYKVLSYNHHSMKGNLQGKRESLFALADLLEPRKAELEKIDKKFSSDLFSAFNNFNIRHNNVDTSGKHYKKPVAELSTEGLEHIYDEVYQMCLLAFMRLDYAENRKPIDELKRKIDNKE